MGPKGIVAYAGGVACVLASCLFGQVADAQGAGKAPEWLAVSGGNPGDFARVTMPGQADASGTGLRVTIPDAPGTDPTEPMDYPAWYVDIDATGANDGTSWPNAFTSIQSAIDAAVGGGEIWVAEGTYPESITMASGAKLYGGFNGTETLLSQRDWETNVTTIDASTAGTGGGAAYHVVVMDTVVNTRLDGLTVTGGEADGSSSYDRCGAGIV